MLDENSIFHSILFNISTLNINWNFIFQFILLYVLYSIYTTTIMYYTVFYVLTYIVFSGIILVYFNMDLFTAFLYLSEFVIIFICILLVFYLNVYGNTSKVINSFFFKKYYVFILSPFFNFFYNNYGESEDFSIWSLNSSIFYENFYNNLNTTLHNDLYGLYLNFFQFNSLSFSITAFLLLIASLVAVCVHLFTKSIKLVNYNDFFLIFDFFKDFSKFIFMRKQNLIDQLNWSNATRLFKKKLDN